MKKSNYYHNVAQPLTKEDFNWAIKELNKRKVYTKKMIEKRIYASDKKLFKLSS